jgi:hypothetical protein
MLIDLQSHVLKGSNTLVVGFVNDSQAVSFAKAMDVSRHSFVDERPSATRSIS